MIELIIDVEELIEFLEADSNEKQDKLMQWGNEA